MKSNENSIFLSKAKKIDLIKNICVNLKCIKQQKIKINNKFNQNINNKKLNNNVSNKNNINTEKYLNIINIKKISNPSKINQKRSKSTKSFSVNNSNKSNIKRNFLIKRNSKNKTTNKTNNKTFYTTTNTVNKKSEFYKKINVSRNTSINKKRKRDPNRLSPINRPKKLIKNNAEITQNNPMELTFGSSSFMSNNVQTETNETDNIKLSMQIKNKKRKNHSFINTINPKKEQKGTKNYIIRSIKPNKIVKLNKKLLLKPTWKIKPNHIMYKPLKSYNNKEKENNNEDKNNKSAFIIENYNKKIKYNDNHKNNNIDNKNHFNLNNITDIPNSKSFIKDNKTINRNKKFAHNEQNMKTKYAAFYNKNLLRNKLFKIKSDNGGKNNYDSKKIIIKNYCLNNSSFYKINIINNNRQIRYKDRNKNNLNETKELTLKINKSVDKEKGKYKLIIKKANKAIKKMPKSTPKLLLTHPSFKNLFF